MVGSSLRLMISCFHGRLKIDFKSYRIEVRVLTQMRPFVNYLLGSTPVGITFHASGQPTSKIKLPLKNRENHRARPKISNENDSRCFTKNI